MFLIAMNFLMLPSPAVIRITKPLVMKNRCAPKKAGRDIG